MITQNELKKLLLYVPDTGSFIYKQDGKRNIKGGTIAGRPHSMGYWNIGLKGKSYLAHRLAWLYMTGTWPEQIDHINHNRADNRFSNIRAVNNMINHMNRPMQKNNKSGCTGVHWDNTVEKWKSEIKIDGKKKHLGFFSDIGKAIKSRLEANVKYGFHANHGSVND